MHASLYACVCVRAVLGVYQPGRRRLLRFTAGIANVGAADLFIGNPDDYAASGFFVYAPCHGHYHFKNYARYELVAVKTGKTWTSSKVRSWPFG